MATIIRNKLTIIPNASTRDEYVDQINDVEEFCEGIEGRQLSVVSFNKIAPKPNTFKSETKEEDDWFLHNWGTRNRAFNSCWISDNEIIFDTFWNPSIPIFLKIVKQFPNIDFSFKFASKRTGTKTGEIQASKGKITKVIIPKAYTKEAFELAFELMPHLISLYVLNTETDNYEYDTSDFKAAIKLKGYYEENDGTILLRKTLRNKVSMADEEVDDLPF